MDVVWVFSGLQDQDELEYSVKSVNNISHNRKIVIGDKPLFEADIKHEKPPIVRWSLLSPHHDVINKLYHATTLDITDDFILMNDDFYCLGIQDIGVLNDDYCSAIIDIYETTIKDEMYSSRLRETSPSDRILPNAPKTIQALWECRRAYRTSREAWFKIYKDLSNLAEYEESLPESERYRLSELGRQGDYSLQGLAEVQQFSKGYGSITPKYGHWAHRQRHRLFKGELSMGDQNSEHEEYSKKQILNIRRANALLRGMGGKDWLRLRQAIVQTPNWLGYEADIGLLSNKRFPVINIPTLHRGSLEDHYKGRRLNDSYTKTLKKTLEYLKAKGIQNPLSYELHIPMIFNKQKLNKLIEDIIPIIKYDSPLLTRSLYGNLYNIGGQEMPDVKNPPEYEDKTFLSTNNKTFKQDIGQYIKDNL